MKKYRISAINKQGKPQNTDKEFDEKQLQEYQDKIKGMGFTDIKIEDISETPASPNPFLRGLGQGATFGLADEFAGLENIISDENYAKERDVARALNVLAKEADPVKYAVGEFLGSIPATIGMTLANPARAIVKPLGYASKLAPSVVQYAAKNPAVINSGISGALSGYGHSDSEDLADQTSDTLIGGGIGLVTGAIGQGLANKYLPKNTVKEAVDESIDDALKLKLIDQKALLPQGFNSLSPSIAGAISQTESAKDVVLPVASFAGWKANQLGSDEKTHLDSPLEATRKQKLEELRAARELVREYDKKRGKK